MAAAAIVPISQGIQGAVKVLSTDIVKLEGRFFRRVRIKVATGTFTKTGRPRHRTEIVYEPVNVSLNANPVGLGVLGSLVAGAAVLLFGKFDVPTPFGAINLYTGILNPEFEAWKTRAEQRRKENEIRKLAQAAGFGVGYGAPVREGFYAYETGQAAFGQEVCALSRRELSEIRTGCIRAGGTWNPNPNDLLCGTCTR